MYISHFGNHADNFLLNLVALADMKLQWARMGKLMECDPAMAGSLKLKSEIEISRTLGLEIEKKLHKKTKQWQLPNFFPSKPSVLVSASPAQLTMQVDYYYTFYFSLYLIYYDILLSLVWIIKYYSHPLLLNRLVSRPPANSENPQIIETPS